MWTAGGGTLETAELECAVAKAEVREGLRASAGISKGAVGRHLCTGAPAARWDVCFTATALIGVSTDVTWLELAATGKAPSGRIKCKLLPTSSTVVPKGTQFM